MTERGFPLSAPVFVDDAFAAPISYDWAPAPIAPAPQRIHAEPVYPGFKALLKQSGTGLQTDKPIHGLRPAVLRAAASWFVDNFPGFPMYAVKCNPSPIVLRNLAAGGISRFDVASLPEIEAVEANTDGAELFYMHPVKARASIRRAYFQHGVRHFSLDCAAELQKIVEETGFAHDLHLHVRLSLPKGEAFHALSEKFGATEDAAIALLQAIKGSHNKAGLCFHVGSQTLSPLPYMQALARVGVIIKKSGVKLDSLDVGGGYPVAYPGHNPAPMIDYMVALRAGLAKLKLPKSCQIYSEPGRALVAEAGSLLVQVELRRDGVQGSALYINDGVYGSLYDSGHFGLIHPVRLHRAASGSSGRKAASRAMQDFILYGPTCDSVDTIKGPYQLPADVQEGDWIEFGQTGSYTAALQSGFNGFYSDQTVLLSDQPQLPMPGYWAK